MHHTVNYQSPASGRLPQPHAKGRRIASSFRSRGARYVWVNASDNDRGRAIVQRITGPTGRWTPVRADSLGTTYRVYDAS